MYGSLQYKKKLSDAKDPEKAKQNQTKDTIMTVHVSISMCVLCTSQKIK